MATEIIENISFYAPWPLFGKKLSQQWGEIRANMEALAPLVQGMIIDADPNDLKAGDLAGLEFGETDFHNKFRIFWKEDVNELKFQCNHGTESVPLWRDAFYISCSNENIVFEYPVVFDEGAIDVTDTSGVTSFHADKIVFNRDDFYLTSDSVGNPIVNSAGTTGGGGGSGTITGGSNLGAGEGIFAGVLGSDLTFKSLVAGNNISLSSDSSQITIESQGGGGFYGIAVGQTDDLPTYNGIRVIKFHHDDFYVNQNVDTDTVIVNFRERIDEVDQITFSHTDTDPLDITSDQLFVNRSEFYLTRTSTGKPILNFAGQTFISPGDNIVSGVAVQTFSSSVEWIFNHNLNSIPLLWGTYDLGYSAFIPEKVDVSNPDTAYFYFTSAVAGHAIVSTGKVSSRINISTTNNSEDQFNSDTLKFNRSQFYLESDSHGHPTVNLIRDLYEKSITIPFPGSNEHFSWWRTAKDITVVGLTGVLFADDTKFYPGIQYFVKYDYNPFAAGTDLITGGSQIKFYPDFGNFAPGAAILEENIFDNPNIDHGSFIWLETGQLGEGAGAEEELHVTLVYKVRDV